MESKFIRPVGAFPNTPEGWKEYEDQWKLETEDNDD